MDETRAASSLLGAFPGIGAEIDAGGTIIAGNEALARLLPRTGSRQTIEDVLDPGTLPAWRERLADERAGTIELKLVAPSPPQGPAGAAHADTREFFISAPAAGRRYLIEIPHGAPDERHAGVLTSVTADLGAAFRTVEEQEAELRRVKESRERFFAMLSHELRTPLTAILGYHHLLLDGVTGELPEQQRRFIERAHTAAGNLKELIDDVLDLAKLESGTLELNLAQTNITPLMEEVVNTVTPLAESRGSEIRLEHEAAPAFITTDERLLRQILLNLLSNAVKFGESRPVRLSCVRAGERVAFEVADQGVGMDNEQIERIFREFVQLEPGRTGDGAGLGLSISRQLATRLGGELSAASAPGAGSTFRLELPITGPDAS